MLKPLAGKKVFLTGATGFLGRHLLPQLLAAGAEVTCYARSASHPAPVGASVIHGDFSDTHALATALRGQEIIIHMAALLFGSGWRDYLRDNVSAAEKLASASQTSCPGAKIIFVSSLAAGGPCAQAPGLTESAIPAPVSAYGWSKLCCEKIFASARGKLVILRPPIIYGSGDKGLLPVFRGARAGLAVSPGLRDFPISAIHAADAARAIILACGEKANGIYHLSDGNVYDMATFCQAMARALGRKSLRVIRMPLPVLGLTAAMSGIFGVLAKQFRHVVGMRPQTPPRWNMDKFLEARESGWLADSSRVTRELGFEARMDLERGMAEAVAGYRAEGWL